MNEEERICVEYWSEAYAKDEALSVVDGWELVRFTSRSAGRGRTRGHPREVNMICRGGICYTVEHGEIQRRHDSIEVDVLANEALRSNVPHNEDRTPERLLKELGW